MTNFYEQSPLFEDERLRSFALKILAKSVLLKKDGLKLYRPINWKAESFHASKAKRKIISGSNRSGKSNTIIAEFCRAARGMDPHGKYPIKNLEMLVVGKDEDHLAKPILEKMIWPGAYEIIPDEITGFWRCVRPDPQHPHEIDPIDLDRKELWMPAPPLIPEHEIADIAWNAKNKGVPALLKMKNGTTIKFTGSKAKPRQGVPWHLVLFDEEVENLNHYFEAIRGLMKYGGYFIWGATPQAATHQFVQLHQEVIACNPGIEEWTLLIAENPYFSKEAKQEFYNSIKHDPQELDVRWYGKYAILGSLIYPMYSHEINCIRGMAANIGDDWMRVLALDPGRQRSCVLFFAVPPDKREVHCYDEVFIENVDANEMARQVKAKCGPVKFEVMLIDKMAGQQTPMGYTKSVCDHYSEAFRREGIASRQDGSQFRYAPDNVEGREEAVKKWLADRGGKSLVRIHMDRCPALDRQISNRFYHAKKPGKREDNYRNPHDAVDTLEFAAGWFDGDVYYQTPEPIEETGADNPAYQYWKKKYGGPRRVSISLS